MARIPDAEIERLKEEVALERLVEAAGVELRRQGKDLVGRCPFHDDRTPSLVVSPAKNLWHCLGACQAGGSVIDWVMRTEGVSFRHAVELLRDGVAPSVVQGPRPRRSSVAKLPSPLERTADDAELLGRVAGFYHSALKESPEALSYLERRRIQDPEAIERFRLGYSNRTLGYRLPAKNRQAGAQLRGRLQRLGVLRESGHEHLSGSLVVPLTGEADEVVSLYGRKIRSDLRPGTALHLYLPGPRRGVFNRAAFAASPELIVCESLIDALTFWSHGQRHVTAAYGADGFSAEHFAALRDGSVERVLIAYDRDEAGERGATALAERLQAQGIDCFRVVFAAGQDANALAMSADDPAGALAEVLRAAVWTGQGTAPRRPAAQVVEHEPAAPARPAPASAEPAPLAEGGEDGEADAATALPSAAEVPEPEPASPLPPAPPPGPKAELHGDELHVSLDERRWRVRGLSKLTSFEVLRVNVLVARDDPRLGHVFHVDTLDLYSARARGLFCRQAADELSLAEELVGRDLGRVLLFCEERAEEAIRQAQAPAEPEVVLSDDERERALELLRDPALVERIASDFEAVGIVGEQTNCLVSYLAAVSRKLDRPLAVIVQSSSAAGKSALQEAVLELCPPEERVSYSAMTGQSLFYMGEEDLRHKLLAIAEQEGAERAAYALKLLQSEGELRIASTGKDQASGRLVTHTYRVRGPVAIFLTTTQAQLDEELLNRCVVLAVDEERAQTQAIHRRQRERETLEGLVAERGRRALLKLHQDAQRLLEPLAVVNPYAPQLSFADARTRTRRDHVKYLTLIRAIALLHQHQRPKKTATVDGELVTYIEATRSDVVLANRLAHEVLGRSLDELQPGARRLLAALEELAGADAQAQGTRRERVRFTRRQLRERLGLGDTQLKVHLQRLVALELVHQSRGPHGVFVYELAWDGAGGTDGPQLQGLIEPDALDDYDGDRSGPAADRSGAGRAVVGPWSGSAPPEEAVA
jgi:DNA primase